MNNVIPPIVDEMGRNWDQPRVDDIALDDRYALMSKYSFNQLAEYSWSTPTGVYPGKMWKAYDPNCGEWYLCWFGIVPENLKVCSNNSRAIIVVD